MGYIIQYFHERTTLWHSISENWYLIRCDETDRSGTVDRDTGMLARSFEDCLYFYYKTVAKEYKIPGDYKLPKFRIKDLESGNSIPFELIQSWDM